MKEKRIMKEWKNSNDKEFEIETIYLNQNFHFSLLSVD
jgi:hypothetical protein